MSLLQVKEAGELYFDTLKRQNDSTIILGIMVFFLGLALFLLWRRQNRIQDELLTLVKNNTQAMVELKETVHAFLKR